jgi:hypothetical protein
MSSVMLASRRRIAVDVGGDAPRGAPTVPRYGSYLPVMALTASGTIVRTSTNRRAMRRDRTDLQGIELAEPQLFAGRVATRID